MRKQEFRKLEIRIIIVLLVSFALLAGGLFYIKLDQYYSIIIEQLKEDAVNIHQFAENVIEESSFFDLNTIEDQNSELYLNTHRQLDEIRRIANIRYLYTAKMNDDGVLVYVVDGLSKDDELFRNIGDPIEDEIIDILMQCLNDEVVLGDEILDTEWGIVYVAYFPFHDSLGNVIGAIGIEFDCESVYNAMNNAIVSTVVISVLLAVATVLVTLFILRRIVKRTETDFRVIDDELSDVHERAMLMLDTSPLCIQIWDKNLGTIDCNEAGVRLYGFKNKQEYIDRFLQYCSPEFQPDGQRSDEKATALVYYAFEKGYCSFDWMHKMPDDDIMIPAEITLVRSTYKGEDVVLGYTRDMRKESKMLDDIKQRDKLLHAVNQAATLLLITDESKDLKSTILASMELIGNSIQADRVHIWRYKEEGDETLLINRYCWVSSLGAQKKPIPENWTISIDRWPETVHDQYKRGVNTNSIVAEMSPVDKAFFSNLDIKSVAIIPLFLDDQLWGLFSLDDCEIERVLQDEELEILRSVSLMMITLINRHALIEKRTQRLAHQTTLLKALFDAIPDHVFVKDLDLRYTQCNKAMYDHFNCGPEDILGNRDIAGQRLSDELLEKFIETDQKTITKGKAVKFEFNMPHSDGEPMYMETIKTPLVQNDNVVGLLGISRDITDHKMMEQKIAADYEYAKKLQAEAVEANQSKSFFLASMSHEIRTPMNAILGATEIMMQSDDLTEETADWLSRIYNSGNLLLGIINDILDLSKIEAGKLHINPATYQIASVINDTVQLNILRGEDKNIEFDLQVNSELPAELIGDELRIKQILNNLLSNAFKFTDEGKITFSVDFESKSNDELVLIIVVRDTGFGMTDDQVDKLFEEYSRFDNTAGITIEGTGLGLHITQRLVYSMDGTILVKSEYGKGSEFFIHLPQKFTDSKTLGKTVTDSLKNFTYTCDNRRERRKGPREVMPYGQVLIVDDVETNRFVAVGLLKMYKLQIETADSGYDAIRQIESGKSYDVIFMDHMMPGIDGVETTKRLRNMGYTAPIVALTANVITGQEEMFLESGFDDFISKPIDIRALTAILNRLIRDKQPPDVLEAARKQEFNIDPGNTESQPKTTAIKQTEVQIKNMSIPGINTAKGFSRYDGDAETYLKILRSYAASVRSILENIDDINESTMPDYIIGTHSIKGASYDIFADSIGSKSEKLEEAGKEGNLDYILKHNDGFLDEAWVLINNIDAAIDAIDADNPKPVKDKPDREALIKLRAACEVYSMDDVDEVMTEIDHYNYTDDDGLADWLRKSIDMMSFSQIVDRLDDYL